MSHNAFVRPGGLWAPNLPVLHTEFALFDLQLSKAINGDDGGTWAPSSFIVIGGAGVVVTTELHVSGTSAAFSSANTLFQGTLVGFVGSTVNLNADATHFAGVAVTVDAATAWTFGTRPTLSNGATIAGPTTFSGPVTISANTVINGTVAIAGAQFTLTSADIELGGPVTITGAASISGAATVGANLGVAGALSVSGTTGFAQPVTCASTVSCTKLTPSAGTTKRPVIISAATASVAYSSNDMFLLRPGSLPQTITIIDGNDGDVLEFSTYGDAGTHTATILAPGGSTLVLLTAAASSGGKGVSCRIARILGTYYVFDLVASVP